MAITIPKNVDIVIVRNDGPHTKEDIRKIIECGPPERLWVCLSGSDWALRYAMGSVVASGHFAYCESRGWTPPNDTPYTIESWDPTALILLNHTYEMRQFLEHWVTCMCRRRSDLPGEYQDSAKGWSFNLDGEEGYFHRATPTRLYCKVKIKPLPRWSPFDEDKKGTE